MWLVLPTYDEADNLEDFVAAARRFLPDDGRILIVDDNSPDGTGAIADRLAAASEGAIEVLHRPRKEGLGIAYIDGFRRVLASGADLICQMDSDFSHDPADLPRLLAAAADADLVIGSRYVEGGGVTEWGLARRLISRGGSIYARTILGLDLRDLTGGFKCFRREALEAVELDTVPAHGYAFQIETTFRVVEAGFRVRELPILFRDRRAGTSKMSRRIVLEAAWRVPMLRLGR
ncbi:MAG TPA: polyprenol monophosphomannose synthase [Solirubrobacterales bacterium]|nr:polyprenol monophosphomannose synthase [Solirubrobacterales bacterium]